MKKRYPAFAVAFFAVVVVALATWICAGSATARPGYTCNPDPGHGRPGCHVAPTSTTARPTTTTAKPTTTTARATTTTPKPTTTTVSTAPASATTTITASATTTAGPTTTAAGPTTTAAATDEGGGLSRGWIALIVVAGAIVLAGLAGAGFMLRRSRRS